MQGIFQKENTDKVLKYGIYRHLPTYEKIIRNLVSFYDKSHSQEVFDNMKRDLQEFIDKDTTAEEEDIFYEEFTSKY